MKIGEFAAACGLSVRMVRFYEEAGIVQPLRNAAGYRLYAADDVAYVQKVAQLNRAGVTLKDIALLRNCLHDRPQDFCVNLRAKLHEAHDEIGKKMADLQASQALLSQLLAKQSKSQ